MILRNNIPQFDSPNRFDALRMATDDNDIKSDEQLNQNDTDSHHPRSINSKIKTGAQQQLSLETRLEKTFMVMLKHKKHVVVKHFSGAKIYDMKHVKPTQEEQLAQIIIHVGTNEIPGNKNSRNSQQNCGIRKFNQNK